MLERFLNRIANQVAATIQNRQAFRNITGADFVLNARTYSDAQSFAEKGYAGNVYVYGAIKQKSEWAGAVPWRVYEVRDEKALRHYVQKSYRQNKQEKQFKALRRKALELTETHPMNEVLERPNPMQSMKEYNTGIFAMKDIAGESFELGVPADEQSREFLTMYFMAPWDVEIHPGEDFANPIGWYENTKHLSLRRLPAYQVLHSKYFNPNDYWRGLSPLQPAIHPILTNSSITEWAQATAENNGYTPGLINLGEMGDLTDETNLRDKIEEQKRDPNKSGIPPVIAGFKGANYLSFSQSMRDAEGIKQIQMTAEQIAVALNWPKELLGGEKKFSNFEQAQRYAYQIGIIPMLDDRRDELNRFHHDGLLEEGKYYIDYDLSGIESLQEQAKEISDRVLAQWRADLITLAEAREMLDLEEPDPRLADLRHSDMRMNPLAMPDVPEL